MADQPITSSASSAVVSPPTTPPPSDMAMRVQILALTEQLETLEAILKEDSTIGIKGISNLRNPMRDSEWEERIHGLLFDAEIPMPWFYDIVPAEMEKTDDDIEMAYIYFINDVVKKESLKRILRVLQDKYTNEVEII